MEQLLNFADMAIGFLLLIGLIAVAVVGLLVYVIARQIDRNSGEDFERRDN